jgi:hypothetical protein
MIQSYEVIRPAGFPYRLVNFQYYFNTENSRIINLHHAAGMDLVYEQVKICYLFPQNEFYQLLKLQNKEEPHPVYYNWIVLKGIFGGRAAIAAELNIENKETMEEVQPGHAITNKGLYLHRLPEINNDIVICDEQSKLPYYHFLCTKVVTTPGAAPVIDLFYLQAYPGINQILNRWFDEENKLEIFV